MRRTFEEWKEELTALFEGTEYDVIRNGGSGSAAGFAIVPKNHSGPQRICIYPKKTICAGLVIELDVYEKVKHIPLLSEPRRIKSNRPHYVDIPDEIIIQACNIFWGKI